MEQEREREALIVGVERIDWHSLHHAYGPADDVPDLLRMLLSDDEAVREDAVGQLYNNIWHQGTVYEATAYVVPFLLRMLRAGGPPRTIDQLWFLATIAEGHSYLEVHARGEWEQQWREILAEDGKELETEREKELGWVEAANRAVGEGMSLYFELLSHEEERVRYEALVVLSTLRNRAAQIVPRLLALLESEQEAGLRAGIVRALDVLRERKASGGRR